MVNGLHLLNALVTSGISKHFTILPNIHPFMHTFIHRQRCLTARPSGAVWVRFLAQGHLQHSTRSSLATFRSPVNQLYLLGSMPPEKRAMDIYIFSPCPGRPSWTSALPSPPPGGCWRRKPPSTLCSFPLRTRSVCWRSTRRRSRGPKGESRARSLTLYVLLCSRRVVFLTQSRCFLSVQQGGPPCHVQQPGRFPGHHGLHPVHPEPRGFHVSSRKPHKC